MCEAVWVATGAKYHPRNGARKNQQYPGEVMNFTRVSIALTIFAGLIAAVPSQAATCSNASINGVFGVLSSGFNGSGQPASSVDRVVVDGAGNLTGSSTKSIDGTIVTFTFNGTYQINKDCTGNATFNNQDGSTKHANIYLNNGKKGAFMIQTDDRHIESSVVAAMGKAVCTDAGVKHTYSFEFTGSDTSPRPIAAAGQLVLNGTGSVKGVATLSIGGSIANSLPVSGTYQINSDCTGTAQITPQGLPVVDLALLVVNAGKEIMAIQTDSGTITAGTLQE
jgi:hypothetical protein